MNYNDDEEKYRDLIGQLKSLKQIQEPENFHSDLMRRISSETVSTQKLILGASFLNSRVVPAIAAGIAVVVIIFLFNYNQSEPGNPLLTDPQVRKDIVTAGNLSDFLQKESSINDKNVDENRQSSTGKDLSSPKGKKSETAKTSKNQGTVVPETQKQTAVLASFPGSEFIDKSGLNFRQINLVPEERVQVKKLKEQMEKLFHQDSQMSVK